MIQFLVSFATPIQHQLDNGPEFLKPLTVRMVRVKPVIQK
jgi:hypothetical protein